MGMVSTQAHIECWGTRDYTYLVVPTVHTSPDLDAVFKLIRAAEEVVAKLCEAVGVGIVEADDEQCVVDNFET